MKLSDYREAAERKYAPLEIELDDGTVVELRQALRLSKDERRQITRLQKELDELDQGDENAEDEMVALLQNILLVTARDRAAANSLVDEIGDDLSLLMGILESYGEKAQLPEA